MKDKATTIESCRELQQLDAALNGRLRGADGAAGIDTADEDDSRARTALRAAVGAALGAAAPSLLRRARPRHRLLVRDEIANLHSVLWAKQAKRRRS
jgi:hypothetical protein